MSERQKLSSKSLFRAPPRVNIVLDLVGAFLLSSLAATGALLIWKLPHGSGRGYAGGVTWLGLGRHEWGDVHFWIALAAVALVLIHVTLHWAWVRAVWPKLVHSRSGAAGLVVLAIMAAVVSAPFLVPVDARVDSRDGSIRFDSLGQEEAMPSFEPRGCRGQRQDPALNGSCGHSARREQ